MTLGEASPFRGRLRPLATSMFVATVLVALAQARVPGRDVPVPRDDDDVHVAKRAIAENCMICHGEELIEGQRLTTKQWKAAVEKMVGWGAPLPKEHVSTVIDYLARVYSDTTKPASLRSMTAAEALADEQPTDPLPEYARGSAARGGPLYVTHCANCHGNDARGGDLGSNLVEKPFLDREASYRDVVRQGRGRMPGFVQAIDASAEADILAWLREQRARPKAGR